MYCPRCGARVDAGFRWCPQCDVTLPPDLMRQPPPLPSTQAADDRITKMAVLAVVIITIFFTAIFAYLIIGGPYPVSPDEEKLTVNLSSPVIVQRSTGDDLCWDLVVNINKITPKDEKVPWTELRVVMKSAAGSILNTATGVQRDAGVYADPPASEFWYVDVEGDGRMSAGDAIKVTGLDLGYEAAHLQLLKAGSLIGDVSLPTEFP